MGVKKGWWGGEIVGLISFLDNPHKKDIPMAHGMGEPPERSPSSILFEVEYPIARDDLVTAAAEAGAPVDAINFLRSLPDRVYQSPQDVQRQFAEADARFGLFRRDVRHRGDIGKEATENGAAPARHR